jgi:hypothetical protein
MALSKGNKIATKTYLYWSEKITIGDNMTKSEKLNSPGIITANRVLPILFLTIVLTFGIIPKSPASDLEDSLLIERLLKACYSVKTTIVDSLYKSGVIDSEFERRIFHSKRYKESCEASHYEKLWLEKFVNAEIESKSLIIDSMFTGFNINYDLISDILLTEKYIDHFTSPGVFGAFKTMLALKTGGLRWKNKTKKILYEYYHNGQKSRPFGRPAILDFINDSRRWIEKLEDSTGVNWAVINLWYYPDDSYNLWLAKKEPDSDIWQGPWYTGINGPFPQKDTIPHLRFFNHQPYLKILYDDTYQLVSPRYITKDSDKDGFYDLEEIAFGTDPYNFDSDGDRLKDGEDINPLAAGVKYPNVRDRAVRAVIKLFASHKNPVNIYILKGDINPQMEYSSSSPNAMFLTDKSTWNSWRLKEKSGGIPIHINIIRESDSLIVILAAELTETEEEINKYFVENYYGDWIVTYTGFDRPVD